MDKQIVLAVAGSGKTYYIANDFDKHERAILISFTKSNVNNIRKEVIKRFNGSVPPNVCMMTFDSFVHNNLLKPFEPMSIFSTVRSNGVDINSVVEEDPRKPLYVTKNNYRHFFNGNNAYLVSRMSKLFLEQDKNFKLNVLSRLEKYCDVIYFDEFQDYNGMDFKTMKYILEKSKLKIVAVGDIYQSCLTPIRSRSRGAASPFDKINSPDDLKTKISKKVLFNETELLKSRRVPSEVCKLINESLGIKIDSSSKKDAQIIELSDVTEIHKVMIDNSITKLIWNKASKHQVGTNYVNWTYSKGDTYSQTCVILTGTTSQRERWKDISSSKTRNALYVALTRTEGDLYLITDKDYKKWKRYASVSLINKSINKSL